MESEWMVNIVWIKHDLLLNMTLLTILLDLIYYFLLIILLDLTYYSIKLYLLPNNTLLAIKLDSTY